ncbi:MAG: sensor histidine kinase [Myxococcales bacterium]|nr:sensor histidine kinase [Myxococcales bacterium]USN51533.1 MAG: sensor histidine kinase [Myxococcales bacterium]
MLKKKIAYSNASQPLALKLEQSFLYRAQAAFFGRLAISSLYSLLWFIAFADHSITFKHSYLSLFLILVSFAYNYACYQLKSHQKLGRWAYFFTLIFDSLLLVYFTSESGYLLSPLAAIHPFITALFLLLFHNPLLMAFPLLSIPAMTILSLKGSPDPSFLSLLCSLLLICFLNALAIFLIYLVHAQEQRLTQSLLEIEKKLAIGKERQRIAREFHDGIGAQLTSIVMQCDFIKQLLQQNHLEKEIDDIQNCAIESIDDMRRSIAFLNDNFDISEQIVSLCENTKNRHNIAVELIDVELLDKLNFDQKFAVCRIAKEAINNALKHACASQISIKVHKNNQRLNILIKDNGLGFDISQEKQFHYGLTNMKTRAEMTGGTFELSSQKNKGTNIQLIFNA